MLRGATDGCLSVNSKTLKIAVVTQYFFPEQFVINDVVRELARQGHEVEVFTGKPNYPHGQIYDGYSQSGCQQDRFDEGVVIHRAPLRPRGSGGGLNLLRNYLSFIIQGGWYFPRYLLKGQFDVIFVYAPSPITAVIPGILVKLRTSAPLFLWVQDLWPESLQATGFIKSPFLLRVLGVAVKCMYWGVDTILVQSRAFIQPVSRYAPKRKIIYYPNSFAAPSGKGAETPALPESLVRLLKDHFCVVFTGNLGTAQSVETILQAAVILQAGSAIKIVVVGEGSRAQWLRAEVERRQLTSLVLVGAFPLQLMPSIFALSSALLVTLTAAEIFSFTIPSKIQAYLSAGRPIIGALNGEGARVIADAGAGFTCPAEDVNGLVAQCEKLYGLDSFQREQMGMNGLAYFNKHFELSVQCESLVALFHARLQQAERAI